MSIDPIRADLDAIFRAALGRVDPFQMIVDHLRRDGHRLVVSFDGQRLDFDLDGYDRVLVLGAGKAAAPMARAVEQVLGDRIGGGLVVTKYGHGEPLERIELVEAGHPTPDGNGVAAARAIAALAEAACARTLVLILISGGGSALLCAPSEEGEPRVTLADKQAVTAALLASGAEIGAINCVRKHLSALKGGGLLRRLAPARSLALILSDVVGDRLDVIASGLTAPDPTSFADALEILAAFRLRERVPATVLHRLEAGAAGRGTETVKPDDSVLALTTNCLIGTNLAALRAACAEAHARGYAPVPLTSTLTGEAREVAKALFAIARDVRDHSLLAVPPVFLVAGGETTVTLTGSGKGGRNQELALAFLGEMERDPRRGEGISLLSAATDGGDGPTDAAGAYASTEVLGRAHAAGLSIADALRAHESYRFFEATGDLLKTGPTRTNVCDLQMILVNLP
ncbi:glycerate kinase type-2 family protein [Magnetospirillum fulvum]|uniref:Hydroxypyruvate reductase n=1 Tax=Magnetospirillum fulvum TaxID=1082 RepID=A0A1H6HM26_MAGFU|nr:glycerate kinase [Magnetospirillum fulvum]SEH35278.1 hydroxypyruvate reductase [Magnetospirillum fulvum]